MIKTIHIKTIISWLLVVAVMVTIFCFSSQEASESRAVSGGLISMLYSLYLKITGIPCSTGQFEATVAELHGIIRKLAHFCIYLLLGFLFTNAYFVSGIKRLSKTVPCALVSSAIYAATDEFHQLFVKGRSGEIRDILIDSSGALTGCVLFTFLFFAVKIIRKQKNKTNP